MGRLTTVLFLFQGNDLLTWEIVVPALGPRENEGKIFDYS